MNVSVSVSGLFSSCRSCLHRHRLTCFVLFCFSSSALKEKTSTCCQETKLWNPGQCVWVSLTLHDVCVKLIRVEFIICACLLPSTMTSPVFTSCTFIHIHFTNTLLLFIITCSCQQLFKYSSLYWASILLRPFLYYVMCLKFETKFVSLNLFSLYKTQNMKPVDI